MSDNFKMPGYYKLLVANIIPYNTKFEIDIVTLIHKIIIEESMDKDGIRGRISVTDGAGLLEKLPLRGEERLILQVEDIFGLKHTFDLFIYKVDNVIANNTNTLLSYEMYFTSYPRWMSGIRKITKGFDTNIYTIAKEIFNTYIKPHTDKEFKIESTEGTFKCVIPNYTPQQTMKFLTSRAYSSGAPSCSFKFFERKDAFYFVPDEYMIAKAISEDNVKVLTFSDAIDKSGAKMVDQMFNLIALKNTDRINSAQDVSSGSYRNSVYELDLVKGICERKIYNYVDERKNYIKIAGTESSVHELHTPDFLGSSFSDENARNFIVVKDYSSDGDIDGVSVRSDQYTQKIISNKIGYGYHLHKYRLDAKLYGRLDISAGDVVKLNVPTFAWAYAGTNNEILSGLYLVSDCVHVFDKDVYTIDMTLLKFDRGGA